ncbi:MAG TPA: cupin domain-containing protein, partial [Phototrophicaceae bacterium]|nr:cupin domain-containing protein [Phototrophicaceae bacterium]
LAKLPLPATDKWKFGVWDTEVMKHGTMSLEIFAPKQTDFQTPHEQDEVYIIVSGSGEFVSDGKHYNFAPGDVLFVPAGIEHRFIKFTEDFVTWVVFYGPKGGEAGQFSAPGSVG